MSHREEGILLNIFDNDGHEAATPEGRFLPEEVFGDWSDYSSGGAAAHPETDSVGSVLKTIAFTRNTKKTKKNALISGGGSGSQRTKGSPLWACRLQF